MLNALHSQLKLLAADPAGYEQPLRALILAMPQGNKGAPGENN